MIYLDHNATTPVDPRVLEAMLPWLRDNFGNAASRDHSLGWDASAAVEEARGHVASLLNAGHHEIFFTSGATESAALVLHGMFPSADGRGIVASAVEHQAVLGACRSVARRGTRLRLVDVDAEGNLDRDALASLLREEPPALVCAMAANNETGVLFPLRACAEQAHAAGALLFADSAQALGKTPLDAASDGFDFAAFSAHKLYGPKGVGGLYIRGGREAARLEPLSGGGQEGGQRAGTLNVAGIVGFGEACRLAAAESAEETARLRTLRDRLEAGLRERIPKIRSNGGGADRLANTANLAFPGCEAHALLRSMPNVAASTRSACSSGETGPSHVLTAMGLSEDLAFASIRFSLGRGTTEADIDAVTGTVAAAYLLSAGRIG